MGTTTDVAAMLRAFVRQSRCEESSAPLDDNIFDEDRPQPKSKLQLSHVFFGWASLLGASIGWSVYNPAHRTLRLSQRVIHARIHAQFITVGFIAVAAIVEAQRSTRIAPNDRNVNIVTRHTA